jgi:hypothetical protein
MTDETQGSREIKGPGKSAAEQRAERLKAALRDNLRRRKAQVRGRSASAAGPDATPDRDTEA